MSRLLQTASILIIEDDENSLLVARRLLKVSGVNCVFGFGSVAQAMATLPQPVDLVLLDVELGEEDGYGLVKVLREDERLVTAVIVALTANVLPQDVQRAREAGFDGFIGKPLSFERFAGQLQQLLDGQPVWQTR